MNRLRRRTLSGVRALPVLLSLLLACSSPAGPIRIGLAGPFTDSVGAPMRRAAELAVEQVNAAGGIAGRPIELVIRNDYGDPDSAVTVASDLVAAGVVAVVGHVYSGTTLASAPVYNAAGVLQISPSSAATSVTEAGTWTFRVCPSELQQGAALARFADSHLHLHRGTILYLNDDYGRGLRRTFDNEFSRVGGEIDAKVPYLTSHPDVGAYLDRLIKSDHSQFVFLAGNKDDAISILAQARARKLTIPFLGGNALEGLEEAGSLAEGSYITNAYLPSLDTPQNHRFVQAYARKYPTALPPNQPAAATYDILHMLTDAMRRAGTDRVKLRDAVADIGRGAPPYQGVTGEIAFDEHGDVPKQRVIIGRVEGGRIRAVEGL